MSALVELAGVVHRYPGAPAAAVTVLEDVDLIVEPGAFTGIVGPSGSGKTTLLRLVTGALEPVAGSVARREGLRIGYVPQVETVDWSFPVSVGEVALMGRPPAHRWPWSTPAEKRAVADVLQRLGIPGLERRHIGDLSGGQQQRVFVARALLSGAELLVLDEPTSGVDVRTRHDLLHLLADVNRTDGMAVLLSTHDLNGLAAHLPHLVALNRRVIAAGPPSEVFVPSVLEATFGAPMEVLVHGGLPLVVDGPGSAHPLHTHAHALPPHDLDPTRAERPR
ncbi:MAG: metal ABC transporter ATP-binding protein [Acidimicrobiales bacterium]|nr:metal ABC transporter ATP-binding protein [Acidimicrobiales bacterium]